MSKPEIMLESEASKVAADIISALMCRLSDRGVAKLVLAEDVLAHCRFVFAVIIERHTAGLRAEIERLGGTIDDLRESLEMHFIAGKVLKESRVKIKQLKQRHVGLDESP